MLRIPSPALVCASFLFVFSFGFLFYRLHFGVDFFDEPFYSALCLRLFSGQALLRDELNLASGFSLFSYPLFWLYVKLAGTLEGIILFMRYGFWALYLVLGFLLSSLARKVLNWPLAISGSASVIVFFPFNILSLSYNTLGTLFLTLSLFLLCFGVSSNRRGFLVSSGVFLGCSGLSYLSFLGVGVFVLAWSFLLKRKERIFFFVGLGFFAACLYPLFFILQNQEALLSALELSRQRIAAGSNVSAAFRVIHSLFPKQVLFPFLLFYFFSWLAKTKETFLAFLVALVPFVSLLLAHLSTSYWSVYPVYLCALTPVIFFQRSPTSFRAELFRWIYIPSFVAGMLSALFSATRHLNVQVGLVPATIASLFCIADFLRTSPVFFRRKALQTILVGLPVLFVGLYPLNIWDDAPWSALTARVSTGPFKGIHTHLEKRAMAEEIYDSLSPHLNTRGPLLIYPNFSAGYLMSFMPPARGTTWYENSGRTNEIISNLYRSEMNGGSRVLRMKIYYFTPQLKRIPTFSKEDPLNGLIETTHQVELETQWFTLWKPRLDHK